METKLRYELSYLAASFEVSPTEIIDTSGKVVCELDTDGVQYLTNWGGSLVFTGDLFDEMVLQDACVVFTISIFRLCDVISDDAYWVGYFTRYDARVDYDRRTWTVEPKEKRSSYCLDAQKDEKYNVISNQQQYLFWFDQVIRYEVFTEYTVKTSASMIVAAMSSVVYYDPPLGCVRPDKPYESYMRLLLPAADREGWFVDDMIITNCQQSGSMITANVKSCTMVRNYIITPDDPFSGSAYNPDPAEFVVLSATTLNGLPAHKLAVINFWPYGPTSDYYTYEVEEELLSPPCTKNQIHYALQYDTQSGFNFVYAFKLSNILQAMAERCDMNYYSEFFDGSLNPLLNPADFAFNPLNDFLIVPAVTLFGKVVAAGSPYVNATQTDLQMSFAEMMQELAVTFNVGWHIDTAGRLRIEHVKYFENGHQYTPQAIGLDLTDTAYDEFTSNTNALTYNRSEFLASEQWIWPVSRSMFGGTWPIRYDCSGDKIETYVNEFFIADSIFIRDQSGISELKNKFYIATVNPFYDFTIDNAYYGYIFPIVHLTDQTAINGFLTRSNLHDKFFRHGRNIPNGYLNFTLTAFDSWLRYGQQTEITVPFCCGDIDLYKLVRTVLGDAQIGTAEIDLYNDTLKLSLRHE